LTLALAVLALVPSSLLYVRDSLDPGLALYKDFGQEYLLGRAIADGVDPYVPIRDLAARYVDPRGLLDKPFPTPHPPSVGMLMVPLSLLDYVSAVRIWFGIQLVCLLVGVALTLRGAGLPQLRLIPVVIVGVLGWAPVVVDLAMGQLTLLLLALMAAALVALRGRHAGLGGALLGFALLVKPLAWPWLLVLVWRRAWSSLGAAAAVVVLGFGLTGMRVGFAVLIDYVTRVLPSVSAQYAAETSNVSLWTVGPRLFRGIDAGSLAGTPPLIPSPQVAQLVGATIPVLVVVLAIAWLRARPPVGTALGVMTCVGILVNPISWQYYLVLALIPAALVLHWLHVHGYPRLQTILALVVGVALFLTDESWYALARLIGTASPNADQSFLSLAGLLTLGPGLAVGALGFLLAGLPPETLEKAPALSVS